MNAFGEKLKSLRKERRITQRDLAAKVDVDFTYISKIENGAEPPSEAIINKMAKVLEVDAEELILLAKKIPSTIREKIVEDDFATVFLRKMSSLTPDQKEEIKKIINDETR